ncbi:MAG: four helix bundle protein [candidate division NC10 bacterium]|jgi:four helix bundle protein
MGFDFEKLKVYKEAISFADEIYVLTKGFPKEEVFGIAAQIRRASLSVPLNIAEGSGRSKREFRVYLKRARTSLYECVPLLELSLRQGFIDPETHHSRYERVNDLSKLLSALIKSVKPDNPSRKP